MDYIPYMIKTISLLNFVSIFSFQPQKACVSEFEATEKVPVRINLAHLYIQGSRKVLPLWVLFFKKYK